MLSWIDAKVNFPVCLSGWLSGCLSLCLSARESVSRAFCLWLFQSVSHVFCISESVSLARDVECEGVSQWDTHYVCKWVSDARSV